MANMNDYSKTKQQLIQELNILRKKNMEKEPIRPLSSAKHFQVLADQSPNMIFINQKGRILFANTLCEELMGYSKDELYSPDFDFQVLLVPDDRKKVMASFQRHMRGEEIAPNEYRLMTKAGKQIDTIVTTKLISIDGDNSILGIITDITELKRTEKLLRNSEKLYKSLIETLPDAVSRTDLSGNITFISNQNLKLLGYKNTEELIGKSAFIFISPDDHKRARANLKNNLSGKLSTNVEYKILRKDGTTFIGEVSSSIIRDSDGEPESILAVVRDVTRRKLAEDKMINYQKQLKLLASNLSAAEERERRKIAQEIHNRIGQSLAVSKIKISELQEQVKESKISKSLENIRGLIEQMISETRSLTFELSPPVLYELGLEPALEWLVEQFHEQHNFQIKMNTCEEIKPINDEIRFVLFDAVRELLMNIVKHSSAKSILISTKRRNNTANITVEDDGNGFDVSKLDFKVSSQDGFGYFHIRERMEYLGGRLSVKSVPGEGTCVTLSVPLK